MDKSDPSENPVGAWQLLSLDHRAECCDHDDEWCCEARGARGSNLLTERTFHWWIPTILSAPAPTSRGSSISQHLRAIKGIPQDVTSDLNVASAALHRAEVHALDQDAFDVLRLIRSWSIRLAPIHRIPPEVLTLIPDFWTNDIKGRAMITLTHVCRTWRDIFTSCPALWTDIDCTNIDKTLVYLDRSRSSPLNLQLEKYQTLSPYDPFLQVIPHVIPRLKSVTIYGVPENLQEIIAQLSPPAPLLEALTIDIDCECPPQDGPAITTPLFNGDLSSLRELRLQCVSTELPWRNMVNLTSFTLGYTMPGDSSVRYLLDFFASAPRLRKIRLSFATPTFGTQRGRLVTLPHLRRMSIFGGGPPSLLFDHLLIPAGAKLTTEVDSRGTLHLPKSLDFLDIFSRFKIHLHVRDFYPSIRFIAPDCQISIIPANPPATPTSCRVLDSLSRFHPLKVERLRLADGNLMRQGGCDFWVFNRMKDVRTLTISRCTGMSRFFRFFNDSRDCPRLEHLILDPRGDEEKFDIQSVITLAAEKAARGTGLKSVKIVSWDKVVQASASKLQEYVPRVECSPRVALESDDVDSGDEED